MSTAITSAVRPGPRHTPGPWEVSDSSIWAKSPFNARVRLATVTSFSPMNGIDSAANASVIANAPDMLATLQHLASLPDTASSEYVRNHARAAIAKLHGGRP